MTRQAGHRLQRRRLRLELHAVSGTTRAIGRAVAARRERRRSGGFATPRSGLQVLDERGPGRGRQVQRRRPAGALGQLDETPLRRLRAGGAADAKALGDVDASGAFWRPQDRRARKSWCESNDPEFAAKAADIVGLYLAPPENAIVLCVDEKPSIQALERKQGYLKLPNGRALTGQSHDYKRHGTSTLFAALEVATGKVQATHKKRRRRVEFLAFMNEVTAAYPGKRLDVILDNLNTHKPRNDRWLARHPHVHFHYTPKRASWLNQVEIWFSILQGQSLQDASLNSITELRVHIDAFIADYNHTARPFAWTKSQVHQKRLKARFADQ